VNEEAFVSRRLESQRDRSTFSCGVEPLDRYFREQATQDMKRRIANCFILVESSTGNLAGYYTLSASSLLLTDLPIEQSKRLPRYPIVPTVLLGRLAVAIAYQGRGLGEFLLADAVERAARADVAAFALVVDAKDDQARQFYLKYGFAELSTHERRLYVPIDSLAAMLQKIGNHQ
jgi:predicted GNAT family N-acyltransferase